VSACTHEKHGARLLLRIDRLKSCLTWQIGSKGHADLRAATVTSKPARRQISTGVTNSISSKPSGRKASTVFAILGHGDIVFPVWVLSRCRRQAWSFTSDTDFLFAFPIEVLPLSRHLKKNTVSSFRATGATLHTRGEISQEQFSPAYALHWTQPANTTTPCPLSHSCRCAIASARKTCEQCR